MFWQIVKENGLTYAEHYIDGRVLYDLCIDHLAANPRTAEGVYLNIEDKRWTNRFAINELKNIVEDFKGKDRPHAA